MKNTAVDPKANGIDFSRVTPKGILGEEEEELLGLRKEDEERRAVVPE